MKNLLFAVSLLTLAQTVSFAQTQIYPMNVRQQQSQTLLKTGNVLSFTPDYVTPQQTKQESIEIGYCNPSDPIQGVGTGSANKIQTCIRLTSDMLPNDEGATIDYFNLALAADSVSDFSIWIRRDTSAEPVYIQELDENQLKKGWNKIVLDTPYKLDGTDVYVGYTLTATGTDQNLYPIATCGTGVENAMILAVEDQRFQDMSIFGFGKLALLAGVTGEFPENDVNFVSASAFNGVVNKPIKITGEFKNTSITELKSLELKYTINGKSGTSKITFDTPLAMHQSAIVDFETGQVKIPGRYIIDLEVTKFNDAEDSNASNNKQKITDLLCLSKEVERVSVIEFATGTWCGFCPRGDIGIEKLEKKYGDKFIGIAVHCQDSLEINDYKELTQSFFDFPSAIIDRTYSNDPYFDIEQAYEVCNSIPSVGTISVSAEFTDDTKQSLEVTSSSTFYYDSGQNPYRVAYILVEDSIKGYTQTNDYSGMPKSELPEDLQFLSDEPNQITDMVLNNVAVGIYGCLGIEGSLEGAIMDGETKSHTYTINMPANIKDINNVRLIAMLVTNNESSIAVINAAEIPLKDLIKSNISANKLNAEIAVNESELYVSSDSGKTNTMEVYSTTGILINKVIFEGNTTVQLPEGNAYIIRINDGNNVVVRKVIM